MQIITHQKLFISSSYLLRTRLNLHWLIGIPSLHYDLLEMSPFGDGLYSFGIHVYRTNNRYSSLEKFKKKLENCYTNSKNSWSILEFNKDFFLVNVQVSMNYRCEAFHNTCSMCRVSTPLSWKVDYGAPFLQIDLDNTLDHQCDQLR